jgi:hypothetical protein
VQNWTGKLNVECWKAEVNPAGIFHRAGSLMNYQAFTNDSLTMMTKAPVERSRLTMRSAS